MCKYGNLYILMFFVSKRLGCIFILIFLNPSLWACWYKKHALWGRKQSNLLLPTHSEYPQLCHFPTVTRNACVMEMSFKVAKFMENFPQITSAPGCSTHAVTFCFPQKHKWCQPANKHHTKVTSFTLARRAARFAPSQQSQSWSLPLGAVCWDMTQSQRNFLSSEAGLTQERVCWGQKHEKRLAFCLLSVE